MSVMNVESLIFVTGLIHLRTIFINLIPIIHFLFHICLKYNTYEIDNEENFIAHIQDKENEDDYFKLINKVEELSGLTEKDMDSLSMAQIDLLLQQIFTDYMGLEKKDS